MKGLQLMLNFCAMVYLFFLKMSVHSWWGFFYMKVDVKVLRKKKKNHSSFHPLSVKIFHKSHITPDASDIEMKNNSVIALKVQIQLYKNYFCNQYTDLPGD